MMKRLMDLAASLIGLILFSPLLLLIVLWIKWDSPGPVFYRGKRAGRYGKPFAIFKFRSMVMNADKIGGPSTSGDDPRVTRSGRFIRRCKLDEVSQLINVLVGDMSLVGPRPEVVAKVELFSEEERETLKLRPGITDWASIWNSDEGGVLAGLADADAAYEKILRPHKMELQRYYCRTRNLWVDFKILVFTAWKILRKDFVPKELKNYPSFDQLRAEALAFAAEQTPAGAAEKAAS
jgi:lipopolysaccharide/colanic/teichoic acid biosynthesis glycosyltransferase